jgi:hypothetical protein
MSARRGLQLQRGSGDEGLQWGQQFWQQIMLDGCLQVSSAWLM